MLEKQKPRFVGKLISIILAGIIGLIVLGFVTGELRYIETLRMPGESRGYLGRRSSIFDSEQNLEKVWTKLNNLNEFQDNETHFLSLHLSRDWLTVVIQNPNNEDYFDTYIYNGNSLWPHWYKSSPYKNNFPITKLIQYSEIEPQGLHRFYTQVKNYLSQNSIETKKDHAIAILVQTGVVDNQHSLTTYISDVRENLSFRADLNGDNFERNR